MYIKISRARYAAILQTLRSLAEIRAYDHLPHANRILGIAIEDRSWLYSEFGIAPGLAGTDVCLSLGNTYLISLSGTISLVLVS